MRKVIAQQLLKYAEKLDQNNQPEAADALTNAILPNYGEDALNRLAGKYGTIYALPQYMSDNYMKIANNAFHRFANDIRYCDSELMEYFNQDDDYDDEPDCEDEELVKQYLEYGWEPKMTSKNYTYDIYKFVLRILERVGAKNVPNALLSEDKDFSIEQILRQPGIAEKFIQELVKMPHETLLKLMPPRYMANASDEAIEEFQKNR